MSGNIPSITFVMLEHHNMINASLQKFSVKLGRDFKDRLKDWTSFRTMLEAHIAIEERYIFSCNDWRSDRVKKMITELLSEHVQVREILRSLDLKDSKNIDARLSELKSLLFSHEAKENDALYPAFDSELEESSREQLVKRMANYKLL